MSETRFQFILTTDYELFGDGSGSVETCMLDPAEALLDVAERYSCPVTLFVEMAELLAFRSLAGKWAEWGRRIEEQIVKALKRQHDVQLHFHPQWIGANIDAEGTWRLFPERCDLASLATDERDRGLVREAIRQCKSALENLGRCVVPDYQCIAFRAGGWAIRPEANTLPMLAEIGIRIDSSTLPGMQLKILDRSYNFRDLPMDRPAWLVKNNLAGTALQQGILWEVPVFTQRVGLFPLFCSLIKRKIVKPDDVITGTETAFKRSKSYGISNILHRLVDMIASPVMRLDYCLQNASEMMKFVLAAKKRFSNCGMSDVPIVMAGHTKTQGDLQNLDQFLEWAAGKVNFATFGEWFRLLSHDDCHYA